MRGMRSLILIGALALLAACVSAPAEQSVTAAPVIAAERAFAARAGEVGWIPAFREYTAPDGQLVGQGGIASAPERMAALPDDGERNLYWAPVYAGIARSGDFGFTTGPASFDAERTPRVQYFTVWRRQPDGSWKWVFDGGPGPVAEPGPYLAAGVEPAELPVAASGAGSAAAAIAQVNAIETGATSASLSAALAEGAHVYRSGAARAFGGPVSLAAMTFPNGEVSYTLVRTEASEAGDMVFTLGEARWTADGTPRDGFFARMWQLQPGGWRIVYDQLIMPPRPAG
jgi:ketosteroid isomerase-like protein